MKCCRVVPKETVLIKIRESGEIDLNETDGRCFTKEYMSTCNIDLADVSIELQLIGFAHTLLVLIKASRVSRYAPIVSAGPARENKSDIPKKSLFI